MISKTGDNRSERKTTQIPVICGSYLIKPFSFTIIIISYILIIKLFTSLNSKYININYFLTCSQFLNSDLSFSISCCLSIIFFLIIFLSL